MKKILALLLITCSVGTAFAQEGFRFGAKGAFYSTWMFNKNISDEGPELDYASTFSPTFGINGIYMFQERYGVSVDLIYAAHNQKMDGFVPPENANNTFDYELKASYLDIPILFRASTPSGPYFEIGPQFSLLMGAKESITFAKPDGVFNPSLGKVNVNYADRNIKNDLNGFGMSAVLGFGVDIKLSDAINLSTGFRFGYMFTDASVEYNKQEAETAFKEGDLSYLARRIHTNVDGDFDYQPTNRVFGGLQLGIQVLLDK